MRVLSTSSVRSAVPARSIIEDCAGFTVAGWSADGAGYADAVSYAPWRRAPDELAPLLVSAVPIGSDDVFVDLGSGDGRLVNDVAALSGCRGVGVEASPALCSLAWADAAERRVAESVRHLPELIGARGLRGATVVFAWLVPGGVSRVLGLLEAAAGRAGFRAFCTVGAVGAFGALGVFDEIGRVPEVGAPGLPLGSRAAVVRAGNTEPVFCCSRFAAGLGGGVP